MKRYLILTKAETAVYNQQAAALALPERMKVVALMHEWVAERVIGIEIRQLEHRFGPLSQQLRIGVEQLSHDALDELATAILDFKSLAEVEAWIARHLQDRSSAT
jgi:hypothetical protein